MLAFLGSPPLAAREKVSGEHSKPRQEAPVLGPLCILKEKRVNAHEYTAPPRKTIDCNTAQPGADAGDGGNSLCPYELSRARKSIQSRSGNWFNRFTGTG